MLYTNLVMRPNGASWSVHLIRNKIFIKCIASFVYIMRQKDFTSRQKKKLLSKTKKQQRRTINVFEPGLYARPKMQITYSLPYMISYCTLHVKSTSSMFTIHMHTYTSNPKTIPYHLHIHSPPPPLVCWLGVLLLILLLLFLLVFVWLRYNLECHLSFSILPM